MIEKTNSDEIQSLPDSYKINKTLKLNTVLEGTQTDNVLVHGADNEVKFISRSEFGGETPNITEVLTKGNTYSTYGQNDYMRFTNQYAPGWEFNDMQFRPAGLRIEKSHGGNSSGIFYGGGEITSLYTRSDYANQTGFKLNTKGLLLKTNISTSGTGIIKSDNLLKLTDYQLPIETTEPSITLVSKVNGIPADINGNVVIATDGSQNLQKTAENGNSITDIDLIIKDTGKNTTSTFNGRNILIENSGNNGSANFSENGLEANASNGSSVRAQTNEVSISNGTDTMAILPIGLHHVGGVNSVTEILFDKSDNGNFTQKVQAKTGTIALLSDIPAKTILSGNINKLSKFNSNGNNIENSSITDDNTKVLIEKPTEINSGIPGISGLKFTNLKNNAGYISSMFANVGIDPTGIVIDSNDNIFISNSSGDTVTKITKSGVISSITVGQRPYKIIKDNQENIYTVNFGSQNITKISSTGIVTTFGNWTGLFAFGICINNATGNLYVVSNTAARVYKITPDGVTTNFASAGSDPFAIVCNRAGDLFVSNVRNRTITKIDASGVSTIFATCGTTGGIYNLYIDSDENLYTGNYITNEVYKITPNGTVTTLGIVGAAPRAFIKDSAGNLYTANTDADTVSKITPNGEITTLGTTGDQPFAIALDSAGNIYTANKNAANVTKLEASKNKLLTLDQNGNVILSDKEVTSKSDFKTINGESLTGSGDIVIDSGKLQNLEQTLDNGNVTSKNAVFSNNGYTTTINSSDISVKETTVGTTSIQPSNIQLLNPNGNVRMILKPDGLGMYDELGQNSARLIYNPDSTHTGDFRFPLKTNYSEDLTLATTADVIPITGTSETNPLTGNIEVVANEAPTGFIAKKVPFEGIAYSTVLGIQSASQYIRMDFNYNNSFAPSYNYNRDIRFDDGGIRLNYFPNNNNSGIHADTYLINGYTDTSFIQKKYVDDSINNALNNSSQDSRPYKTYTALLTQTEENDPTAIVLENTLGGEVIWKRMYGGAYKATLQGSFTIDKTTVFAETKFSELAYIVCTEVDYESNNIYVRTCNGPWDLTDGILRKTAIEIKVYN
jgi:hypothetical protein